MAQHETQPSRPRRSVYVTRPPITRRDGRRLAETDADGVLRWREDWRRRATGWWPLDAFLRGRR